MAQRNFARGEPPPANSWEWSGVAKPPTAAGTGAPTQGPVSKPGAPAQPVAVFAMSETIVLKKKRSWLGLGIAGAIGFLLGYKTGSY